METTKSITVLATALLLLWPGQATAQQPSSDVVGDLQALVSAPAEAERDRHVIEAFLAEPRVETVATDLGIDPDRLRARARAMDGTAAADLATRIHRADDEAPMVGGDAIVISSTAVIIALLVLILVSV
jgi:hypothetical protein